MVRFISEVKFNLYGLISKQDSIDIEMQGSVHKVQFQNLRLKLLITLKLNLMHWNLRFDCEKLPKEIEKNLQIKKRSIWFI